MGLFTRASAVLDRGAIRLMEQALAPTRRRDVAANARAGHDPRAELIELAAAYRAGTRALPSPFFPAPTAIAPARTDRGAGPLGTRVTDLAWVSDYVPFLPAARDSYLAHRENLTAHARWWTTPGAHRPTPGSGRPTPGSGRPTPGSGRPTIVALHGWGADAYWLNERAFDVAYWLRHGYDVALFVLPFHGARMPAGRPSGSMFPSANATRTNEAFGHAIYDLRALHAWLIAQGASCVGAMGMSLGGYTTALWATVSDELAFAVAVIPAVSMAELMWEHGKHGSLRKRAAQHGISSDLLADAFEVHSPLARPPLVARERRMIIAGEGDQITPRDQAEALAAHWQTDILWFAGGHLAQFGRGDATRAVRKRLGALAVPGRAFRS